MSEWFLTRAGAGTVGPLLTESVLDGIADGRVPVDATARAIGEAEGRPLARIPVFAAAVQAAVPLADAPPPFAGLVDADRALQAGRRAERERGRQRRLAARFGRIFTPFRHPNALRLVAIGVVVGGLAGVAAAIALWPAPPARVVTHARATAAIERAARRVAASALAGLAPAPTARERPGPPSAEPPAGASGAGDGAVTPAASGAPRPLGQRPRPPRDVDPLDGPIAPLPTAREPDPHTPTVVKPGF